MRGDDVAGLDALVVGDRDGGDVAGDLGGERVMSRLHIGVVGRDHEAAFGPPLTAIIGAERQSRRQHGQDHGLLAGPFSWPAALAGAFCSRLRSLSGGFPSRAVSGRCPHPAEILRDKPYEPLQGLGRTSLCESLAVPLKP